MDAAIRDLRNTTDDWLLGLARRLDQVDDKLDGMELRLRETMLVIGPALDRINVRLDRFDTRVEGLIECLDHLDSEQQNLTQIVQHLTNLVQYDLRDATQTGD